MTPFACERYFEGVISGISATTGVRQKAIARSRVMQLKMNNGRTCAKGMMPNMAAASGAPTTMKGRRRPIGDRKRSENTPKAGWMIRAAMLSNTMMKDIKPACRPNCSSRMRGTKAL